MLLHTVISHAVSHLIAHQKASWRTGTWSKSTSRLAVSGAGPQPRGARGDLAIARGRHPGGGGRQWADGDLVGSPMDTRDVGIYIQVCPSGKGVHIYIYLHIPCPPAPVRLGPPSAARTRGTTTPVLLGRWPQRGGPGGGRGGRPPVGGANRGPKFLSPATTDFAHKNRPTYYGKKPCTGHLGPFPIVKRCILSRIWARKDCTTSTLPTKVGGYV